MVTIKGIGIKSVNLASRAEDKDNPISGVYTLVSSNDTVMAEQSFGNGYSQMKMTWSLDTLKARDAFLESMKRDMETVLGLSENKENT